ncbi:MAG: hypothetical protein COY40_01770, partial [Alphaproteobacteria bacterium CG_4_10_14_0_8_um_filter_53_9]
SAAAQMYTKFRNGHAPDKVTKKSIPDPRYLVECATATAIEYKVKKGDEPTSAYRHVFKDSKTKLYTNKDGKLLMILGPFTVNGRGIVGG